MVKKTPDPTDKYVGSRVRMRRTMPDVSQKALGEELGVTFQQVQKYEKGANRTSASRLQHIAQTLQVPVSFFFEGGPATINGKLTVNNQRRHRHTYPPSSALRMALPSSRRSRRSRMPSSGEGSWT